MTDIVGKSAFVASGASQRNYTFGENFASDVPCWGNGPKTIFPKGGEAMSGEQAATHPLPVVYASRDLHRFSLEILMNSFEA
jgi:hypothetical protein